MWTRTHRRPISVVANIVCFLLTAVQTGTSVGRVGKEPHSQLLIMPDLIFHVECPGHVINIWIGIVLEHFSKHVPRACSLEFYPSRKWIVNSMTIYLDSQTLPTCEFIEQRNQCTLMGVIGHHNITHPYHSRKEEPSNFVVSNEVKPRIGRVWPKSSLS
jgi:hypothetical protein